MVTGSLTCNVSVVHILPLRPAFPFCLPYRCKLSITASPDLTLASPVGELILFNMQIAELCFGLCQQYSMGLVVWLSGNTLVVINKVTLRQARLILGWVTVCGQVHHLGM